MFVVVYVLKYNGIWSDVLKSDAAIMIILTLFSISCGFLSNMGMIYGTDKDVILRFIKTSFRIRIRV